ncbi:hypothetical protein LAUMK13_00230 [Mycobacterium innocens]|uniref:Uncharacterized protein n=1 Tax=Mycobacterium innocens TaxID=2341083 RepID=A0A498PPH9_9MYCO|nr:hypothetical protein LAUMK13_00230 [Mycobacterium innocens]
MYRVTGHDYVQKHNMTALVGEELISGRDSSRRTYYVLLHTAFL